MIEFLLGFLVDFGIFAFLDKLTYWVTPGASKEADRNIKELEEEAWFKDLLDDYRYSHIIWTNTRVRSVLALKKNVERLKSDEEFRFHFTKLVIDEHFKFTGVKRPNS